MEKMKNCDRDVMRSVVQIYFNFKLLFESGESLEPPSFLVFKLFKLKMQTSNHQNLLEMRIFLKLSLELIRKVLVENSA